jgi:serine protease Do
MKTDSRRFRNKFVGIGLALAFVAGLAIVLVPVGTGAATGFDKPDTDPKTQQALTQAQNLSIAFEHVAEHIRPSLASVRVVKELPALTRMGRNPLSDLFGDNFRGPFNSPGLEAPSSPRFQQGSGSAFVVSEDGYLLTNHHVIENAAEVEVVIQGETYPAQIVGSDPQTDLAVLQIEADNLVAAQLGTSDDLRVGQWVVAAGDPFGLAQSITSGIVSAKGRSRVGLTAYEDFIQTDAAINPGNSGGPLVDLDGEVIGVNTAIASRNGGYMGVGFAIPVDLAKSVMTSLIDNGRVERGWLGVTIQELNKGLAKSFGYDRTEGALVGDVSPDSPAARAGLEAGDILIRYDGTPIDDTNELRFLVAATRPGSSVDLDILRDGKRKVIDVEIGELEEASVTPKDERQESTPQLGMNYQTLDDETARRLGYDKNPGGIVVTRVEPFSAAARAGLSPRDVIVEVDGTLIKDADELGRVLRKSDLESGVRLTVNSSGAKRFLFLESNSVESSRRD